MCLAQAKILFILQTFVIPQTKSLSWAQSFTQGHCLAPTARLAMLGPPVHQPPSNVTAHLQMSGAKEQGGGVIAKLY